jgi:flavin reductase (DIM6/NTAB) family NADH-FMN oxidoreductase RutF
VAVREELPIGKLTGRELSRLLKAVVVPRPIAWVSTVSPEGIDNLAPHSFFTAACFDPPIVQFGSIGRKDSLRNAVESGEFVVNFSDRPHFEQINATATDHPPEVSEFEAAGVAREDSSAVKAPRVADSPVALECLTDRTVDFGTSTVVFGRVVHISIASEVMVGDYPQIERLDPVARLGKNQWATVGEVLEIDRVPYRQAGD